MKEKARDVKLPGFTAEASLYNGSSDYFGTGSADSHAGTVAPASLDACLEYGAECVFGMMPMCLAWYACLAGAA